MAYSAPVDTGVDNYTLVFRHLGTQIEMVLDMHPMDGANPTRAQRDAVFQALLDKVLTLNGVTLVTATRSIYTVSNVTSP